ncbi:MAG: transcriptional regulator/antitoxin MazE [Proteobacteria bacterium]|nr:MAG: transcriptional regulator/antitoxin MazE [Pseudomonadota bacterium]
MLATISSWGNSLALRVPKDILNELDLSVGDRVKMSVVDKKIILEPQKLQRKKYNIKELVKKVPKDYKPHEEISDKMGLEVW